MSSYSVGISTTSLISGRPIDGMAHYTQKLIASLALIKIKCKGFGFSQSAHSVVPLPLSGLQSNFVFPHSYQYYLLQSITTFGKFPRFNPGVELFHSTDPRLIPMTCPIILTCYDSIPVVHPEWCGNGWFDSKVGGVLRKYRFKHNISLASHIIAISQHAANDIIQHFDVGEKEITVVYIAADDRWFEPTLNGYQEGVIKKYNLPGDYFLSVGTIQPRKNFDRLIDAYLSLPLSIRREKKLVIVGKYGWGANKLIQRMRLLQEEGVLIWLSAVSSDDELRCIYRGASVFIFPSLYEGFGIPLVEAFASKIPAICSNVTSLPEVSAGAALEINPYSVGEIAEAMQLLATNSAERAYRIKLGSVRVEQFRWKNIIRQVTDVYERVLKDKG